MATEDRHHQPSHLMVMEDTKTHHAWGRRDQLTNDHKRRFSVRPFSQTAPGPVSPRSHQSSSSSSSASTIPELKLPLPLAAAPRRPGLLGPASARVSAHNSPPRNSTRPSTARPSCLLHDPHGYRAPRPTTRSAPAAAAPATDAPAPTSRRGSTASQHSTQGSDHGMRIPLFPSGFEVTRRVSNTYTSALFGRHSCRRP
jgi:hypothetical protein